MVTQMNPNSHPWPQKEIKKINKTLENSRFGPVTYVAETGSTNTDLLNEIGEKTSDGMVLVAGHQKTGRGRLERQWEAPPGTNLLFSILLHPRIEVERMPLLTPTLAVSLIDVLERHGLQAGMKWPNDVHLTGDPSGKVAGILAEVGNAEIPAVVVGMGCNISWPLTKIPELPDAVSILAARKNIQPSELLLEILLSFEKYLTLLEQSQGPNKLRELFLKKSVTIGKKVSVQQPNKTITGQAVDLSVNGALIVENSDGQHHVMVGDVIHLRSST